LSSRSRVASGALPMVRSRSGRADRARGTGAWWEFSLPRCVCAWNRSTKPLGSGPKSPKPRKVAAVPSLHAVLSMRSGAPGATGGNEPPTSCACPRRNDLESPCLKPSVLFSHSSPRDAIVRRRGSRQQPDRTRPHAHRTPSPWPASPSSQTSTETSSHSIA
jgi:hypothetical protein